MSNQFFQVKEMSNFKQNILGVSLNLKFGQLRKPQTFFCGNVNTLRTGQKVMYLSSNKRIILLNLSNGIAITSISLNRQPVHGDVMSNMDKKRIKFSKTQLSNFIEQFNGVAKQYQKIN